MKKHVLPALALAGFLLSSAAPAPASYSVLIHGGTIYDGSGRTPYVGDVAITGDRISYVGPHAPGRAARVIDASGRAVSPGFINMLSWANESLIADGRGLSDTYQGVTLEVMGEGDSMGPWNSQMKRLETMREGDIKF
ncbi:MAG TPA: D-aminoacylase, partial [Sphingomicrobium sp.]|nr:D-aminoacylase [Sphingomicrobium sp.]